jgi:hypothetical protein
VGVAIAPGNKVVWVNPKQMSFKYLYVKLRCEGLMKRIDGEDKLSFMSFDLP